MKTKKYLIKRECEKFTDFLHQIPGSSLDLENKLTLVIANFLGQEKVYREHPLSYSYSTISGQTSNRFFILKKKYCQFKFVNGRPFIAIYKRRKDTHSLMHVKDLYFANFLYEYMNRESIPLFERILLSII